ncbi:hypothetical protein BN1708_006726 [Verticillium longisporum]|uniref:Uncharacterized protein n=2 Tax=Verticillium longisporum TaxID=100787 RepID=A0A0G4MMW8_VERLO|nr:hypothetical protein BN1708_006726 [Verticillium longisporum]
MREVNREHELTIQALDRLSVARRAQIWGQFYQGIREKREQYLESLNQEWYETQNARRSAHSVPDYSIQFPTIPAQRTRNAVAYNTEVAYLAGLAKHEGFPAVPAMRGASAAEIDDDLEAIKRASRSRQRSIMQPLEDYQAVSFGGTLGPAGEQFIKNTPWANPNHISHKMQHVPLHSEPGSSAAMPSAPPQAGPSHAGHHHHHHHHHQQQQQPQQLPPPPPNGQATSQQSPTLSAVSPETLRTASVLSQGVHMKHAGMGGMGRGSKAVQAQEPASKQDMPMAVAT